MVILLKERSTASPSALLSAPGSTAMSVIMKQSMVAILGAIIPAPLAIPTIAPSLEPTLTFLDTYFGNVSVVMMALAASLRLAEPSDPAISLILGLIFSIGSLTPMTPVEQGYTRLPAIPRLSPTVRASSSASRMPGHPVQAFAFPLFTSIALALPDLILFIPSHTDAAFTLFVVNVAAAEASVSE